MGLQYEETFGCRLKDIRSKKGMTQSRLAQLLDLDKGTLSKYENNKSEPEYDTLRKLVEILGCSIDYLILGKEIKSVSVELSDQDKKLMQEFLERQEFLYREHGNVSGAKLEALMRLMEVTFLEEVATRGRREG